MIYIKLLKQLNYIDNLKSTFNQNTFICPEIDMIKMKHFDKNIVSLQTFLLLSYLNVQLHHLEGREAFYFAIYNRSTAIVM